MSSGAAIFVLGPAGSGKSSFCNSLMDHCRMIGRSSHLINLDPGAEDFIHEPSIDIRTLVNVLDVMEEHGLGPNGAQIFCYEYLVSHLNWLEEEISDQYTDEFLIIDCPGQIEIYTHMTFMTDIIGVFERKGYRPLALYLIESHYMMEAGKYYGATLSAISCMLRLGIPHLNIMSKIDLIPRSTKGKESREDEDGINNSFPLNNSNERDAEDAEDAEGYYDDIDESHELFKYLNPDKCLFDEMMTVPSPLSFNKKHKELTEAIVQLIDEFDMVSYLAFSTKSEKLIQDIVLHIDNATQYAEGLEPRENNRDPYENFEEEIEGLEREEYSNGNFEDLD